MKVSIPNKLRFFSCVGGTAAALVIGWQYAVAFVLGVIAGSLKIS